MVNFEKKQHLLGYAHLFVLNETLACFFSTFRNHIVVLLLINVKRIFK